MYLAYESEQVGLRDFFAQYFGSNVIDFNVLKVSLIQGFVLRREFNRYRRIKV